MNLIIFSNDEETLYGNDLKVSQKNLETALFAHVNHAQIILNTNNPSFVLMENLTSKLRSDYLISSSGALISEVKTRNVLFKKTIDIDRANLILEEANKLNILVAWWNEEEIFFNDRKINSIYQFWKSNNYFVYQFIDKITFPILKFCFKISENEKNKIRKLNSLQKFALKLNLSIVKINDFSLEIIAENISKASSIKWLLKYLNVSEENIMTIGYSNDDVSMLENFSFSYAMSNANDKVKAKAHFHTSSVEQDGWSEAVIDFLYRKGLRD